MVMSIGSKGMTKDYVEESKHTVAMKFPNTQRPMMRRTSYSPKFWNMMVMRAHLDLDIAAVFVMDNTEEGQAILHNTDLSEITQELLLSLSESDLLDMAELFGVKTTSKNPKVIALKILAAKEEGVKPKQKVAV